MGRFIFVTAVAVWLGTVVSFSFMVLPTIHAVLSERAAELLHRLFPRYYAVGLACGLVALAAVSLAPAHPLLVPAERVRLAFPVIVSLPCTVVAQRFLLPRLARPAAARPAPVDERLHRASVMLNTTVLAMLILAMAAIATR